MFANVADLARRQGQPTIVLHPADAERRGLNEGDEARVANDRGAFTARVVVSDRVRAGVAAASKGYWPKHVPGGFNANATVAERDSDMGGGAVFHDNRVEVTPLRAQGD
jgi:anaerobic selenocysteine-containing dehydrogenase